MKYLDKILKSWKTVFTYDDIQILLWIESRNTIKSFLDRQIKAWIFESKFRWIYALSKFDIFEFASKLKKNSYISFETVLKQSSIIFQDYWKTIFLASDNTITKKVSWTEFKYLKIKNDILHNPLWLISKGNFLIATAERAICDRLYLSKDYYFDNLDWIDKKRLKEVSKIYNRRVISEVDNLIKNVK